MDTRTPKVTVRPTVRSPGTPLVVCEQCPPRRIHELLAPKWASMLIYVLSFGPMRTGQLQRSMPGVSKKMLTQTLRELEHDGLIDRTIFQVVPPMVEYSLTDLGRRFVEPLIALYEWAETHADVVDAWQHHRQATTAKPDDDAPGIDAGAHL